ncbi:hypothetical protein HZB06_00030 [Candidatus Wolfebacteria bacterium]|nr:hypothetical protein [Candidatus Wolfebacteria bacterium]
MMNLTQGINFWNKLSKTPRRNLKPSAKKKEIKTNLLAEARRVGDAAQIAVLEAQLNDIDGQIDTLGTSKRETKNPALRRGFLFLFYLSNEERRKDWARSL